MAKVGLHEADMAESFIRGSGPGGQKQNKTSNCVQIKHLPSGIVVRCQQERSQSLNRFLARRMLVEKLEQRFKEEIAEEKQRIERIRRQKRRRSKRAKEKALVAKRIRSAKKKLREKVEREGGE